MQSEEYSKKNFKTELRKKSKIASEVFEEPAVLSYEELGGLSDPGPRGLRTSRSPYWAKGIGRVLYLIYVVFYLHAE
jgi:hypothetical protein